MNEVESLRERLWCAEAERNALRERLSELVVVRGQALACSPSVKKAFEDMERVVEALCPVSSPLAEQLEAIQAQVDLDRAQRAALEGCPCCGGVVSL